MRTEPTWEFTGQQIADSIQRLIDANEESYQVYRAQVERVIRQHDYDVAEWKALPEQKRGPYPYFGIGSMSVDLHYQQRDVELKDERSVYLVDPARKFQLTMDDVIHFGLGVISE